MTNSLLMGYTQRVSTKPNVAPLPTTSNVRVLLSLLVLVCIALLAAFAIRKLAPPEPVGAGAPETEFSSERALVHVRAVAKTPHPIGSSAQDAAREYLVAQLSKLGLNPQVVPAVGVLDRGRGIVAANTQDITGRLAGTASSGAIMLVAHYDSVYLAPGAADDVAGVAAILETVRALRAGPALKNDVIVLITDGEEAGLLGAEAFAAGHPWMKDVGLIMNFEARGNRGASLLFETSPNNGMLINAVAKEAPHPIGSSLFYSLYKLLPNDTDFTVFRPTKTPGLNFAFGEDLEAYHSRLDSPDNLDTGSLQHHGSYALGLTRYFGQTDLKQLKNSRQDDVFFDWLGSSMIAYGANWIIPGEIIVTILLIAVIVLCVRRSGMRMTRAMLALLPSLAMLLLVPAAVAAVGWIVVRLLGQHMIQGDSQPDSWLLSGLVLAGAFVGCLLFAGFRKRFSVQELSLGGLILVCILSWVMALMLPTGSYLLFCPLLLVTAGLLAIALVSKTGDAGRWSVAVLPGTIVAILLFAPIIYLLYVFLTLQLLTMAAVGVLLAAFFLLCAPIFNIVVPQGRTFPVALVLLVCALVSLVVGIRMSHYSAQHPRHDTILYSLNADDHTAAWISYDRSLDPWTEQFFSNKHPVPQPMPNYLGGRSFPVLAASTAPLDLAPPIAEIKADTKEGDLRKLRINVRSLRNAEFIAVRFTSIEPISLKVANRDLTSHRTPGPLNINLLAMGNTGADLELTLKASSPISFWLLDQTYGLPTGSRPRAENFMAGNGSDVTLVGRKYTY